MHRDYFKPQITQMTQIRIGNKETEGKKCML